MMISWTILFFLKDDALDHCGQLLRQPAFQARGDVARGEQGGPQPVLAVAHFAPEHHVFLILNYKSKLVSIIKY